MRIRIFLFFVLGVLMTVFLAQAGFSQNSQTLKFPKPEGFVNDFAALLAPNERASLEALLQNFEQETSNEIVIAIVPNLQEMTVDDYAVRLFEEWGIGKKKNDNGVLFLVSQEDKKMRIEVGYGLEGAIPDGKAGEILDREVVPEFRQGNYAEGLQKGMLALMAQSRGEYATPRQKESTNGKNFIDLFANLIFFLPLFLAWFASFLGRSKRAWPGGILGAFVGGGVVYFFSSLLILTILGTVFFGGLGFLFDYLVSKNYAERKRKGLPTDFWHSGGGFWLGGGRGGGGGFGGFGGGFSGGGGASRGW